MGGDGRQVEKHDNLRESKRENHRRLPRHVLSGRTRFASVLIIEIVEHAHAS